MNNPVPSRIEALRTAMREAGVHACLVPSADPHLSEYLPGHWQARVWLSGFTGSAGTLVVTLDEAGLWTDSRYFEQAETELAGSGVALQRLRVPHTPEHLDWLASHLSRGQVLAVAGDSLSPRARDRLLHRLSGTGASLRCDLDLPGQVWAQRPPLPVEPLSAHETCYLSENRRDRLARIRAAMQAAGATHHLVSSLDDVAWITQLRGNDVAYNPVFLAHLLIGPEAATLFTDTSRVPTDIRESLRADGIELADYADTAPTLSRLPGDARLLLDPARVVCAIADALPEQMTRIEQGNPSTAMKAVKTDAELDHVREVMRQDGAALVQAFHRLERGLAAGETLTELDVERFLLDARSTRPGFVGESFSTIAGYMANGALPHYSATPEHHATLGRDGLLLVDSGGQYGGGTTDITRVWAFGETTAEQREDCTRVLKGMIALSNARFPHGASGPQLDALARAPIWAAAGDYGHGTGHGVGYFLNVHEGPQGIRPPAPGGALVALEPGMINSIEPGLYKPGRHGIRHENLAAVRRWSESEFGSFLCFETLTLCPFDTRALEPGLLDAAEREWLNAYHRQVQETLSPLLDAADRDWLEARCTPI